MRERLDVCDKHRFCSRHNYSKFDTITTRNMLGHVLRLGSQAGVVASRNGTHGGMRSMAATTSAKKGAGKTGGQKRVVLVDGVRTPFQLSNTGYDDLTAQQLQTVALRSLIDRNSIDAGIIDYVLCGTVIQEVRTSNVARESVLAAGFPDHVPAHTVTQVNSYGCIFSWLFAFSLFSLEFKFCFSQACISANQAIATAANMILAGNADIVVAGGVETMSDVPIRFSRKLRKRMLHSRKAKSPAQYLKYLKGFSLGELAPELPAIAEFSTVPLRDIDWSDDRNRIRQ